MLQHWYHSRHGDRFRLLGDIDVRLDGGRVDVGHARQRCVLAGQVAVLSGDGRAAAPLSRLLRMLRDMGVTYWADDALDVAGLVLAGRCPEEAAAALCAGRPADDGDGRLGAMRERLVRCRARLAETLGPRGWEGAAHRARTMPVEETIVRALAALETA
jgi:hypothetical protein